MRRVMSASILIAIPGAIFAPLISQVHAVSFCETPPDNHGLLLLLTNDLPSCPTQPATALIVLVAIAAVTITFAWAFGLLYTSQITD